MLTDHHATGFLAKVAPVAVHQGFFQLVRSNLTGSVLINCIEPLLHLRIDLRSWWSSVSA